MAANESPQEGAPDGPDGAGTRTRSRPSALAIVSTAIAVAAIAVLAWLALEDDPLGGEPVAIVSLEDDTPEPAAEQLLRAGIDDRVSTGEEDETQGSEEAARDDEAETFGPEELLASAAELLGEEGFDGGAEPGGTADTGAPESAGLSPSYARRDDGVRLVPAPHPDLVTEGKHGPLPVIAADGRRPAEIYARPLNLDPADAGKPRVAIVIGGMGISEKATDYAIDTLPPEVTLAFAPYGRGLQRTVDEARDKGHEVWLSLPMEPYDYPQNDPGPYTLLTTLDRAENLDRLEWLLSRFTGYAGVTNYQGAKFSATEEALRPVLESLESRGLAYLDDGSSARSLVTGIADEVGLSAAEGDALIDITQSRAYLDEALVQLETIAKSRGVAVGIGSGFPATVDRVSEWAGTLEDKGIVLIPLSASIAARQS